MNNRTKSFTNKFKSAQSHFGSHSTEEIISVKLRSDVRHDEYSAFIDHFLKRTLHVTEIKGEFAGRAWLVSSSSNIQVILVEHETGLEILYIAGSLASLIGLVPLIVNGWRFFRKEFMYERSPYGNEIEIRQLSDDLNEKRVPGIEDYILSAASDLEAGYLRKIADLEGQVDDLKAKRKKPGLNRNRVPKKKSK